jgi:hypothetical protein
MPVSIEGTRAMRGAWLGAAALCLVAATAGCGAGSAAPGTPSTPPPTANSIAITSGDDALRIGFFSDFTVTATMSDRTTQIVTPQAALSTSDPSVATIDANGRVTALKHGTVAINASYQGRSASRTIASVHDYAGTWNGTFAVRSCSESGVFIAARYCLNASNQALPLALELTQSGPRVDRIAGLISLRGLAGPISGEVTADGGLSLSGSYVAAGGGSSFRIELQTWSTTPVGNTSMSGSFAYNSSVVGSEGVATQTNEILTIAKKLDGVGTR